MVTNLDTGVSRRFVSNEAGYYPMPFLPPGPPLLLERETSSVSQAIGNKTLVTLPLDGRDYAQLLIMAAGSVQNPRSAATDGFNVNGNRSFQNRRPRRWSRQQ